MKGKEKKMKKKPLSPCKRRKPWKTLAVLPESYAKVKELASYNGIAMGEQIKVLVDEAFDEALKESQNYHH